MWGGGVGFSFIRIVLGVRLKIFYWIICLIPSSELMSNVFAPLLQERGCRVCVNQNHDGGEVEISKFSKFTYTEYKPYLL